MAVMTRICLVLHVGRVDSDTTGFFFRRLVNLGVTSVFGTTSTRKDFGNSRGQSSLAVIDVAYNKCKDRLRRQRN